MPQGNCREVPPNQIVIQHLFTHTSGLTYNFVEESPVSTMYLEAGLMRDAHSTLAAVIAELARFHWRITPARPITTVCRSMC